MELPSAPPGAPEGNGAGGGDTATAALDLVRTAKKVELAIKMYLSGVAPFSGQGPEEYIKWSEPVRRASEKLESEAEKKILLTMMCTGTAHRTLMDAPSSSFNALMELLSEVCTPSVINRSLAARERLRKFMRPDGGDLQTYLLELKSRLSYRAENGTEVKLLTGDAEVHQYLLSLGPVDSPLVVLARRLALKEDTTEIDELHRKLRIKIALEEDAGRNLLWYTGRPPVSRAAVHLVQRAAPRAAVQEPRTRPTESARGRGGAARPARGRGRGWGVRAGGRSQCWHCGQWGHMSRACPNACATCKGYHKSRRCNPGQRTFFVEEAYDDDYDQPEELQDDAEDPETEAGAHERGPAEPGNGGAV
jgi:hypothetical protein